MLPTYPSKWVLKWTRPSNPLCTINGHAQCYKKLIRRHRHRQLQSDAAGCFIQGTKPPNVWSDKFDLTRRAASTDRTARRQFQATGQTVSRTQASDTMTSRLPRYETKCVQGRCFQRESVPLRSDIKGTELAPANILIPLERQLIALQLCRWHFLYNETFQQTFRSLLSKLSKRRQI